MQYIDSLPPVDEGQIPVEGQSQSVFRANASYVWGWIATILTALNTFVSQINTLSGEVQTKRNEAVNSATTATEQATIATTKAGEASASAIAAANAQAAAELAYDMFDDRSLGAKASDPVLDNDGNPLQMGATYWNTTIHQWKTYDATLAQWFTSSFVPTQSESISYGGTTVKNALDAKLDVANITAAPSVTPSDTDFAPWIVGGVLKRLTWENIKTTLNSYFATLLAQVGEIKQYAGATAPTGWLLLDGSAISRTTYATLFAVIGTTYGAGDGSTTFNLPDLRGRTVIGAGSGTGLTTRTLGTTGGEESHTLTINETPSHGHSVSVANHADHTHSGATGGRNANHRHRPWDGTPQSWSFSPVAGTAYGMTQNGANNAPNTGIDDTDHTHSFTTNGVNQSGAYTHTVTQSNVGGGLAHNNMTPFIALNYIIKY